jgi:hypothetical protein
VAESGLASSISAFVENDSQKARSCPLRKLPGTPSWQRLLVEAEFTRDWRASGCGPAAWAAASQSSLLVPEFQSHQNMLKPSNPLATLTCSVGRSGTALPAGLSPGAAHGIVWIGRAELAASLDQASLPLVCTIHLAGAAHFVVGIGLAKLPTCLDQVSLPFLPRHGGRRW